MSNCRNWWISSSTVHNIIKRFRESGEISARKQQGPKPTLNGRDLWPLRRRCIKNPHHCVKDISTWAQEHFRKPLSVNTVHHYIYKWQFKLYHAKTKSHINNTHKRRRTLFGNHGRGVLRAKEEKDNQDCSQHKVQKQHLWWYGGVLVPMASWVTVPVSVKAALMLKGTNRFWSNICCHPRHFVFFRDVPDYFSKTMKPRHILLLLQQWVRLHAELNQAKLIIRFLRLIGILSLVCVYKQLRKPNYLRERVLIHNIRWRYMSFQRVNTAPFPVDLLRHAVARENRHSQTETTTWWTVVQRCSSRTLCTCYSLCS